MGHLQKNWYVVLLTGLLLFGGILISGCSYTDQTSDKVPSEKPGLITTTLEPQDSIARPSQENNSVNNNETVPTLPDFMPGIEDKPSYEEMQQLMKNYSPPSPVPESEMAWIIFSKEWVMENDEDPDSDVVQLTFPATWLNKSPVSDDDAVVLLRVPARLLELQNTNPDMVTVTFSKDQYKEFPNISAINLTSGGS
ncbi:MAG: hypothetical protein LUQ31_06045 [Methanoregula sp.]|nr:hypothetical protein [Methanoregula sp.]